MADLIADSTRRWVLGLRVHVTLVTAAYSVIEVTVPAGVPEPPPHIHHDATELFYVLEGELEIHRGQERLLLTQGQSACVPRGVLHTFANPTSSAVRLMTMFDPAGFEKFFIDMGVSDQTPAAQLASIEPALIGRVIAEAGNYHMEIPAPPPAS